MKKVLDYIPPFLAFFAVGMGVSAAQKWDGTQSGFRQLTPFGWLTVGLGAAALLASLFITRRSQREGDLQARQRKDLQAIAHAEVRLALRQITWPFFDLFGDDTEESHTHLVPQHIEDAGRLASVMRIELRSKSAGLSGITPYVPWAEVLKGNADSGTARVDRAMQIYAAYLDPGILKALSELRTSEFLVLRLQRLDEHVQENTHVKFLEFPFVNAPDMSDCFGFGEFWKIMRSLDKSLYRDPDRLRRRL